VTVARINRFRFPFFLCLLFFLFPPFFLLRKAADYLCSLQVTAEDNAAKGSLRPHALVA
jgi:hypothetical protein